MQHRYGYRPDLADQRDYHFRATVTNLPAIVDLRSGSYLPPVYDQGNLGSCTANALAAAYDFDRAKQGGPFLTPSRLFIYWNERSLEGTVSSDAGAALRDGIKVLKNIGTPSESAWPYAVNRFTTKPAASAFTAAKLNEALSYRRLSHTLATQLSALASGIPFVAGISVYESFENQHAAATGVIPMPAKSETLLGGHAVLVVGYNIAKSIFVCRNSWGSGWGDKGYFYLPFKYLTNARLASDMWVIETVKV